MMKLRRRVEKFNGLCVGLDLHKKFIQMSVLDRHGDEVEVDRFASAGELLLGWLDRLEARGEALRVVIEASGCFVWVYDLLIERLGRHAVQVAAPSKVKVIAQAGEKTDASDAWPPESGWRTWRTRVGCPRRPRKRGRGRAAGVADRHFRGRELRSVIDERSDLMRRMRSHLAQLGETFAASAWASAPGRAKIERLVNRMEAEHDTRGQAIARLWSRIQAMNEETQHWRGRVHELSLCFDQVKLLKQQLPGVGPLLAAVVWSPPEVTGRPVAVPLRQGVCQGDRTDAGLPSGGASRAAGGANRRSRAKARRTPGSVRWALTRAVLACSRCKRGPGVAVRQWVEKQSRRKPKKAAMVAAARKLAEAIWRLFSLGQAFDLRRAFPT